ncbi:MAG: endonuclease/exonuclease/phosphatase family protein [Bryobacterales bacterium]|nr:endonuclease/exonuclease/phosphatase family protein [Bryobacterales bacterium]
MLIAGIASALLAGPMAPAEAENTLRVVTYNIHHGVGNDGCAESPAPTEGADCGLNLQRIAEVVARHRPDVVALQEVDRNWLRSAGSDQPAVFAHFLGMHACYGANLMLPAELPGSRQREYGNLILSRFPIAGCRNLPLPKASDDAEQRGLLLARVQVGRQFIQIANTHLHVRKEDRMLQTKAIADMLRPITLPIVLMGDMNARPGDPELAYVMSTLRDAWQLAGEGQGLTSPATPGTPPRNRIDYILHSPALLLEDINVDTSPAAMMASDHYPVVATLVVRQ